MSAGSHAPPPDSPVPSPSTAVAAPAENSPAGLTTVDSSADAIRAKLGAQVVFGGLAVVLIAFVVAVLHYNSAAGVATAVGSITGVVGAVVGAYFGVQVGSQGKATAEAARTQAENQAKALATVAPAAAAARVLGLPPSDVPSPEASSTSGT